MEKQSFLHIRNLDIQAALEEERRRAQPAWELRDGLEEAGCLNQIWCCMCNGWLYFTFVKCVYVHVHIHIDIIHICSLYNQIYMFLCVQNVVDCWFSAVSIFSSLCKSTSTLLSFTERKALKSTCPHLPCGWCGPVMMLLSLVFELKCSMYLLGLTLKNGWVCSTHSLFYPPC